MVMAIYSTQNNRPVREADCSWISLGEGYNISDDWFHVRDFVKTNYISVLEKLYPWYRGCEECAPRIGDVLKRLVADSDFQPDEKFPVLHLLVPTWFADMYNPLLVNLTEQDDDPGKYADFGA
jgi:hypothetical protein